MAKKQSETKPSTERTESRLLISYAFDLARNLDIDRVLVLADLLQDRRAVETQRKDESIIWVVRGEEDESLNVDKKRGDACVEIPEAEVDRMDQVKLGLIMAVLGDAVGVEQSVVCLAGAAGSKRLDNLLIANPSRDFPWFAQHDIEPAKQLASREFARLLEIALKFGNEGREGRSIGTIFVLGNSESLEKFTRPFILNPCAGHPRKLRQIHNPDFLESMRELAGLDGAFIVDRKGVVESAGVYLDAPLTKKVQVAKGLGARHTAAAAISAKGETIAIVVSESSGTVTVFSQGAPVLEIGRRA